MAYHTLLKLLGGADDITDALLCEDLVAASPTRSLITVRRYTGARHGVDIVEAPPVLEIGGGMTIGHQPEAAEAAWRARDPRVTFGWPAQVPVHRVTPRQRGRQAPSRWDRRPYRGWLRLAPRSVATEAGLTVLYGP